LEDAEGQVVVVQVKDEEEMEEEKA